MPLKKAIRNLRNKFRSLNFFVIVAFASIGYFIFPLVAKLDSVQYASQRDTVSVKIADELNGTEKIFNLHVHSKLPIDTIHKATAPVTGKPITEILYHENPAFTLWAMLISLLLTVVGGAFPYFIWQLEEIKIKFQTNKRQIKTVVIASVSLILLLSVSNLYTPGYYKPPDVINDFHILLNHGGILKWIESITALLALPAVATIFLCGLASENIQIITINNISIKTGSKAVEEAEENVEAIKKNLLKVADDFNYLEKTLSNGLHLLAIIVALSVVTSGVLGMSIKAAIEIVGLDIYPSSVSYVYGMFFSLFLSVIYFPAYFYFKYRYNKAKENIQAIERMNLIDEKWFEKYWSNMKHEDSALDNFRLALTILTPLLSSLLPKGLDLIK